MYASYVLGIVREAKYLSLITERLIYLKLYFELHSRTKINYIKSSQKMKGQRMR